MPELAGGGAVESHVGSALSLGTAPAQGSIPIGCEARTGITASGFPLLACEGLVSGTSGAPWVSGSAVIGLVWWSPRWWVRAEHVVLGIVR
nr:hypothetical protein [Mycobacterium leprae]